MVVALGTFPKQPIGIGLQSHEPERGEHADHAEKLEAQNRAKSAARCALREQEVCLATGSVLGGRLLMSKRVRGLDLKR